MNCPLILRLFFLGAFTALFLQVFPQNNDQVLVGYWHNWNDFNAPYIPLNQIDDRYNVVSIAFAVPASDEDMTMQFVPDGTTPTDLVGKIETLKSQGKKVLISVGGATAEVNLDSENDRTDFVNSLSNLIDTYGFNGLDIDIEHGSSTLSSGGSIQEPANPAQVHLIEAVKEIMSNYREQHSEKLYLTITPETAYVQGGQSAYGGIWGGYLPVIHGLRDSLDILQVQLYNSGTMFGVDGGVYTQGTSDFVVAMTEAVIQGFETSGGFFNGLPAEKVVVGLPACESAAGGGYLDPPAVGAAIQYLRGMGPQPGDYALINPGGYPDLKGMMTWSINWDAVENCDGSYMFAQTFEDYFTDPVTALASHERGEMTVFPNPAGSFLQCSLPDSYVGRTLEIIDLTGRSVVTIQYRHRVKIAVGDLPSGPYILRVDEKATRWMKQ